MMRWEIVKRNLLKRKRSRREDKLILENNKKNPNAVLLGRWMWKRMVDPIP